MAMACGKPIIGTGAGSIPDQIIDGVNGFLVKPKEPRAIADINVEERVDKVLRTYHHLVGKN